MAGLASINIKFFADLKQFSTQMQNANRKLQKMGKQLQGLGTTLSVGVTAPFVGFSVLALKNWDTQEKAIAQVEAGLSSVGDSVGYTSEQLQKMASGLQETSLFGDEDILKNVTAQLLTFTNIANEEFSRTQKVALDLATRLGGDLKGASIQLGKALNDPIANLSALSRSGIQFSEDQKALIKSFAQTNRLADAQNVILNELEKQYGGSAAAAAKAGTGSFKQLSNSIGDLSEEFGKIIGEFLVPFVEKVKGLVTWFQKLSVSTKKIIVVVSAFAAALGPLLLSLGFLMTTVIPGLTTAFAGLSAVIVANPLGVLAIALTAVVSGVLLLTSNLGGLTDVTEQWSEVTKKATKSIADEKLQLDKNLIVARDEGKSKKERLKAIDALKKQYPKYLDFLSLENINTQKTKDATNQLIDALLVKAKVQAAQEKMVEVEKKLLDLQLGQNEAIKPSLWQDMGASLKSVLFQRQFQIEQGLIIAENYGKEKTALEDLRDSLRDYISDNDDLVTSLNKVKKASVVPSDTSNKGVRRKVTGILSDQRGEDGKLEQTVNLGIVEGIKVEGEELKTELQGIQQSFIDFSEQTSNIIAESTSSFLAGFGEMIGGLFTGSVTIADIGGMILRTVGDFLKKLGKAAIQVGVAAKAIHLAFTNPFAAIAAGVALIAIGSVFSNLATQQSQGNAVPFANGGIVYGPYQCAYR
ncbi:hypothetical protein [Tenacibaculum sp. nBUS_03]|uniref:hypothetical protein n=1 Tax=Tenacibaculum sp. nBUS_03 TaxID=3395320 RepID=UPI003EBF96BD